MALTRPKFNNIDSTIVKISDAILTVNQGNSTQQTMGVAFDRSGWSLDSVGLIWNHNEQRFEVGTLSSNGVSSIAPSIVNYGTIKADTFSADTIESNALVISDLELINNSDTKGYEFFLTRSRGNISSPTAVQVGDEIFKITGNARNAVDYSRVVSIQSFSTGTNSANLEILLHDGSSLDTRLTLDSNGDLTVTGNVTGGNIISDGYFYSNGTPLSLSGGGGSSYTDSDVVNLLNNFGSNAIATSGNVTVGNFELTGTVTGNIVPSANAVYNLGSPTNRFNTLYLVGNTIDLGGATISADSEEGVVAIIPQRKPNQTTTKAILIGDSGIATADTDSFGLLSQSAIQEAMTNRVTVTGSLLANTLITTEGNIVAGNLKTDGLTIVRGIQSLGEDGITSGGNIQAPYFLGNGSLLTGLGNHYQDSDVANLLADLGPTSISTNSNITGNIITATRFVGNGSELTGITSSITVSEIDSGNTLSNSVGSITTLSFDIDSGFAVDDVGNGIAKVRTNSTFKTIVVDGQGNLVAQGLDTLEIISGNGISITTNPNSDPKSLTISGTYGDSNVSSLLTNYATTNYVDNELANLVASAPSTLDTLNELASALGNDAAFSTSITNLIGNNTSNIATLQSEVANLNYYDNTNVASYLTTYDGNITAGNILSDNYFYANGEPFSSANNVTVANIAPSSPSEGDVWIDTTDGVQYIYFNDGDSLQWVDMQSTIVNVGGSGYADSDVLNYLGSVAGNIIPAANVTYNLGSETQRWNTLYLAGNTIDLGGAQIKADPDAGTIALIPQVKPGQSRTKAIVIGERGVATVDTDTDGTVSAASIASAAISANTITGNVNATGVTVTNSLVVNTTAEISGNITAGNIITDNIFFSNGDPFVSGGGATVTVSDSPPADPSVGDIWFNGSLGVEFLYINDGDSSQWVETKTIVYQPQSYGDSDVASYLTEYTGNITAGNILTDNYFYANGEAFVSGISYDQPSTSTGFFALPTGNTNQRPTSNANGYIRFNSSVNGGSLEGYLNGSWVTFASPNYTIDYLVVAGGGAGGTGTGKSHYGSGGGGAGGLVYSSTTAVSSQTVLSIIIGAGAPTNTYSSPYQQGSSGSNTTITQSLSITAIGGGGGGSHDLAAPNGGLGGDGGSGGGGTSVGAGGSGTFGQGNEGGSGISGAGISKGSGGGGAVDPGSNSSSNGGTGNGGDGLDWQGLGTYYAGGGGGGGQSTASTGGTGGQGGGGDGGSSGSVHGVAGGVNTGGGGGGGFNDLGDGGAGGSGIVIIRYLGVNRRGTGGNITSDGTYTYHTFTSSGTFTA